MQTDISGSIFNLDRLFFDLDFTDETLDFSLKTRVNSQKIRYIENTGPFSSEITVQGYFDRKDSILNYNVELKNLKTESFILKKQNFSVISKEKTVKILKIKARDPFDLSAVFNTDTKKIILSIKFENYKPDKYLKYNKNNKTVRSLIRSVYSGDAEFIYDFNKGIAAPFSYSGNITMFPDKSLIPGGKLIDSSYSGNPEEIEIKNMQIKTDTGNISYKGTFDFRSRLPDGFLELNNFKLSDRIFLNSGIKLERKSGNSVFLSSDTVVGDLELKNIDCLLTRNKNGYIYDLSYIDDKEGFINSSGNFYLSGKSGEVKTELKVRNIDIKKISDALSPGKSDLADYLLKDRITLNTTIQFYTDFRSFNIYSQDFSITENKTGKEITADLALSRDSLTFYNIGIDWGTYQGKSLINLNKKAGENKYSIDSFVYINKELFEFSGDYSPGNSIMITGNHNLTFSLFFSSEKSVFHIFTDHFPVPVGTQKPEFSLNIKGSSSKEGWNVMMINNRIYNIPFLKGENSYLSFSSIISDTNITISRFSVKDRFSSVDGSGEILIDNYNRFSGWIRGLSSDKDENYLLMLDYKEESIEITADFNNLPVERVTDQSLSGNLSGVIRVTGEVRDLVYSVEMNMYEGKFLDDPLSFDLSLNASSTNLIINRLSLKYNQNRLDSAAGFINKDDGLYSFRGSLLLKRDIGSEGIQSNIDISGDIFDNDFKWLTNPFFIENKGIIRVSDIENSMSEYTDWEISYINNESFFIFNGGPGNSIEGEISRGGSFNILLSEPIPVRGNFSGRIKEGKIEALLDNIEIDLNTFGNITNISYFNANSGTAKGKLNLQGAVNDPDFTGQLSVSGVKATSTFVPEELVLPNTSFLFNGKNLTMPKTAVNQNGSSFTADLQVYIDHWLPREFSLYIKTDPDQKLWIKHRFSMVDIDGYASGAISIDGDGQKVSITGDLVARKCIITLSEEEKKDKSVKKDKLDFEIDLTITTGAGVEFFWPSVKIPILRTFASAGEKLSIYRNSASKEYSMTGDIKIQGGEVFYFSQSFFLKEGYIVFDENQTKFDPHLTARAELRERTSDNQEVKISLIADDTPLSQFSPKFESSPPLSDNEIYTLLGENVYSQFGGENITFGSALLGAGAYSTQLIGIMRPFENQMKKMLKLDLFTIRTNLLQKAVYSESNPETAAIDRNTNTIDNYLDNTTIFMGKYFGEYFFLEGLLSFNSRDFDIYQYNDYDVPDFMGMYVKTEVSLEVDTPLFLMDLTLYPRLNDFNNSLLDTSLEFSWRFSY